MEGRVGLWGRLCHCSPPAPAPAPAPAKEFDAITHIFLFLAAFLSCKIIIIEGRYFQALLKTKCNKTKVGLCLFRLEILVILR